MNLLSDLLTKPTWKKSKRHSMRSSFCFVAALVLTICSVSGVSKKNSAEPDPLDPQDLRGAYLGQQPPGLTPRDLTPGS